MARSSSSSEADIEEGLPPSHLHSSPENLSRDPTIDSPRDFDSSYPLINQPQQIPSFADPVRPRKRKRVVRTTAWPKRATASGNHEMSASGTSSPVRRRLAREAARSDSSASQEVRRSSKLRLNTTASPAVPTAMVPRVVAAAAREALSPTKETISQRDKGKQVMNETTFANSLAVELNPTLTDVHRFLPHPGPRPAPAAPSGSTHHHHPSGDLSSMFIELELLVARMRDQYAGTQAAFEAYLREKGSLRMNQNAAIEQLETEQQVGLNYALAELFNLRDENFALLAKASEKDAMISDLSQQQEDALTRLAALQKQRDDTKSLMEATKRSLLETQFHTAQKESSLKANIINLKADIITLKAAHATEISQLKDKAASDALTYRAALFRYAKTGAFLKGVVDSLRQLPRDPRTPSTLPSEETEVETLMQYYRNQAGPSREAPPDL